MIQKQTPYRSDKWLAAVRSLDECVRCGRFGVQAAHRNQGKGLGSKVDDTLCAALCPDCHHEIDNGKQMTMDERRREMDACILETIKRLARAGKIGAK